MNGTGRILQPAIGKGYGYGEVTNECQIVTHLRHFVTKPTLWHKSCLYPQ